MCNADSEHIRLTVQINRIRAISEQRATLACICHLTVLVAKFIFPLPISVSAYSLQTLCGHTNIPFWRSCMPCVLPHLHGMRLWIHLAAMWCSNYNGQLRSSRVWAPQLNCNIQDTNTEFCNCGTSAGHTCLLIMYVVVCLDRHCWPNLTTLADRHCKVGNYYSRMIIVMHINHLADIQSLSSGLWAPFSLVNRMLLL